MDISNDFSHRAPSDLAHRIFGEVKPGQIWQVNKDIGLIASGEKFIVGPLIELGDHPRQHIWQCLLCNPAYPDFRLNTWQILIWCTLIANPDGV